MSTREITLAELLDRYRVICLDAYGVLVTTAGALEGARELIDRLNADGRRYYILTNDASRRPETAAAFYQACGLAVPPSRVLTAGLAVEPILRALEKPRCFVFGTRETASYVERAGGLVLPFHEREDCDAVVVGDDSGFDFVPALNAVLTSLHRQLRAGRRPKLLLANADLIYPRGSGAYGFTSGAIARLLELGLGQLEPGVGARFEVLGKPGRALFDLALGLAQTSAGEAVMIGDQLHTDVKGANRAGLASCLVTSGVTRLPLPEDLPDDQRPTFVLSSLRA